MLSRDFDYPLPASAIAQRPSAVRDLCRLAVVDRASGQVEHTRFRSLPRFLRPGDLLVLNDSRVLPVRLPCRRLASGGAVEAFLLAPLADPGALPALLKAGGHLQPGEILVPLRAGLGRFLLKARLPDGRWLIAWQGTRPLDAALLARLGLPPLPPYIRRERLPQASITAADRRWYQTVYARHAGSVAAPTAGLHFTPGLFKRLASAGVERCSVTLHVGAGTFQPVKAERLEDHEMHAETCSVPPESALAIQAARARRGRVIAVGTTALRCLESAWLGPKGFRQGSFETRLFMKPGDRFKVVDALVTNFHQPRSTLLALVSAFWERQKLLNFYNDCLARSYRFLSYGDACFFH